MELKKISGDSILNSIDFSMNFGKRKLRNKSNASRNPKILVNSNKNNKAKDSIQSELMVYSDKILQKKENFHIQTDKNYKIDLNKLTSRYYNEIIKEKNSIFFIELKINPEIIYEDEFINLI